MYRFLLFLLVVVIDGSILSSESLPEEQELPDPPPEFIESFKRFLERAKGSKGTYHRFLLISSGVIQAPVNYTIPIDHGSGRPAEIPLSPEMQNYFAEQVDYILSSEERTVNALNVLLGKGLFLSELTNQNLPPKERPSSRISESTADHVSMDSWIAAPTVDGVSLPVLTTFVNVDPGTSHYVLEDNESVTQGQNEENLNVGSLTTEYINFLTKGLETSEYKSATTEELNVEVDDSEVRSTSEETNPEPSTEEYMDYLQTKSVFVPLTSTEVYSVETDTDSEEIFATVTPNSEYTSTEEERETSVDSENQSIGQSSNYPNLRFEIGGGISLREVQSLEKVYASLSPKNSKKIETSAAPTEVPDVEGEESNSENSSKLGDIVSIRGHNRVPKQTVSTGNSAKLGEDEQPTKLYLIPGIPGEQFPNYDDIPETKFACGDKQHIPGFYADKETDCQVFHVCWPGRRESFLCPLGTTFNQAILACDYWYSSNCSISHAYFDVNTAFKTTGATKTGHTDPMVDTLIKAANKDTAIKPEIVSSEKAVDEMYEADVHFSESIAKHELSQIWRFLPVKAKVYVQPQPSELQDFLAKLQKQKRSKGEEAVTSEPGDDSLQEDEKLYQTIKENVESHLLKVLKFLSSTESL